jgi:hypothetical protein
MRMYSVCSVLTLSLGEIVHYAHHYASNPKLNADDDIVNIYQRCESAYLLTSSDASDVHIANKAMRYI